MAHHKRIRNTVSAALEAFGAWQGKPCTAKQQGQSLRGSQASGVKKAVGRSGTMPPRRTLSHTLLAYYFGRHTQFLQAEHPLSPKTLSRHHVLGVNYTSMWQKDRIIQKNIRRVRPTTDIAPGHEITGCQQPNSPRRGSCSFKPFTLT